MAEVRVRFAPSPTGPLHIGGVRTALYNYLFARKHKGKMILRIEDTDQKRFVPGAEEYILESLEWCGISFDEGVHIGGDYGPYRQSERKEIYLKYANQLIQSGHAYYAFDTPEEIEGLRAQLESEGAKNFSYSAASRDRMINSLSLSENELIDKMNSGVPYVVRVKVPDNEDIFCPDIIRGEVTVNSSILDDKVILKADGMPTYHLANIVDDHLMKISHVIRGEEWLPSLPLHFLLYQALNWDPPQFAHMPLTLKPSGKGKLSKRDGDALGFPVFPVEWKNPQTGEVSSGYRESGYFPEAFINIMAFLGWNPGTEQEIFSMEELIKAFTLERVGKSGSRFDPNRANWYNNQYLQTRPINELTGLFQPELKSRGIDASDEFVGKVINLVKERVNFVKELWDQSFFFFIPPDAYDEKMAKKRWKGITSELLSELTETFNRVEVFNSRELDGQIQQYLSEREMGMGQIMPPLRLALVGSGKGPGVTDIMEIIGKEETINRIRKAIQTIK